MPNMADYVPYAQITSTLAAATAMSLTSLQLYRNRAVSTLQTLTEFLKASTERHEAFAQATEGRQNAFNEFMEFLEVHSGASNGRLIAGVAREIVNDKLTDAIVLLRNTDEWRVAMKNTDGGRETYKHLRRFKKLHRKAIDKRLRVIEPPPWALSRFVNSAIRRFQ